MGKTPPDSNKIQSPSVGYLNVYNNDYGHNCFDDCSLSSDLVEVFNSASVGVAETPKRPWLLMRLWTTIKPRDPMIWVLFWYGVVHLVLGVILAFTGRPDLILLVPMGIIIIWVGYFMDHYC